MRVIVVNIMAINRRRNKIMKNLRWRKDQNERRASLVDKKSRKTL